MAKLSAVFDWHCSPRHIEFLTEFRKPRRPELRSAYWEKLLKENVSDAVDRFFRDNALAHCDVSQKVAHLFTADALREVLIKHARKPTGGKATLVKTSLQVAQNEMARDTRSLNLFQCTSGGLQAIDEFKRQKEEAEAAAQTKSYEHLMQGKIAEAVAVMAKFRQSYLNPDYPGGSTNIDFLKVVFGCAPRVMGALSKEEWRILRVAAAMKRIWRTPYTDTTWLPETFRTAVTDNARAIRLLLQNAKFREQIVHWPVWATKTVSLRFESDQSLCEACSALQGAIFDISDVPDIPTEGCTSSDGCFCYLDPFDPAERSRWDATMRGLNGEVDPQAVALATLLRALKQMLKDGLIERCEYDEKTKEILARM